MTGTIIERFPWHAFILPHGTELPTDRVFMPWKNMQQTSAVSWDGLMVGTKVSFTPIEGPEGWRAIEVRTL
jgi:hypothetical protein